MNPQSEVDTWFQQRNFALDVKGTPKEVLVYLMVLQAQHPETIPSFVAPFLTSFYLVAEA